MRVILRGRDLPGSDCGDYRNVHVALQVGKDPHDPVSGDADEARWETEVEVRNCDGRPDFRGPAVHGRPGQRFLYLTWGELRAGSFTMFRRAKLLLDDLGPGVLTAAVAEVTVSLTDSCGMPRCARLVPPAAEWSLFNE